MNTTTHHRLVDPDPVSVALGILGAVGSLCSIAGYVQQVADRRRAEEIKDRTVLAELIENTVQIETSIVSIQGSFERIRILISQHSPFQSAEPDTEEKTPFVIGGAPLLLPRGAFRDFSTAHQKIVQDSKVLLKNLYATLAILYKTRVDISQGMYEKLLGMRAKLQRIQLNKLDYDEALAFYSDLLETAAQVAKQLKNEFVPKYGGSPSESQRSASG